MIVKSIFSPPVQSVHWSGFDCHAGVTYQIAASRASDADATSYEVELDVTSLRFTSPLDGTVLREGETALLEMAASDAALDGVLPEQLALTHDPSGRLATVALSTGKRQLDDVVIQRDLVKALNNSNRLRFATQMLIQLRENQRRTYRVFEEG